MQSTAPVCLGDFAGAIRRAFDEIASRKEGRGKLDWTDDRAMCVWIGAFLLLLPPLSAEMNRVLPLEASPYFASSISGIYVFSRAHGGRMA